MVQLILYWNRYGNVLAFEEINRLSREVLIKTKDIVQQLRYELIYADTDSVFIKRTVSARDYDQVIDTLSSQIGLSISIDYHYKFTKGYENALLLVTQAIDTIMTGEGVEDKDLIISKLLRQDIQKYRSLFPHVSAAIQSKKYPSRGEIIQYIYTDSKHNNPLCRVVPIENLSSLPPCDKEMILDAAETVLGFFGFDRTVYSNSKKGRKKWRWYEELREQRVRDIETEIL